MSRMECPWCTTEVTVDPARSTVRCEACLVEVEFAPDPPLSRDLAAAA